MKRHKELAPYLPQYDYGMALRTAMSWLGDRYLLAQPVARRVEQPPFFMQTRSWHDRLRRHH
ncbi:MAG TPA: hypothetical protein VM146_16500 [Steroidobacteraceae bacterium]|nr:hypothetical protein [Steroidobacteraceae bacterium]